MVLLWLWSLLPGSIEHLGLLSPADTARACKGPLPPWGLVSGQRSGQCSWRLAREAQPRNGVDLPHGLGAQWSQQKQPLQ